ncbi:MULTISPECIES: hypothetical protein [unclassified Microcoleus]|uniref:hypothetical protein n=1 Tax=unclassified Microcoleus TaxID=2642155 RepID=UPI002FCF43F2
MKSLKSLNVKGQTCLATMFAFACFQATALAVPPSARQDEGYQLLVRPTLVLPPISPSEFLLSPTVQQFSTREQILSAAPQINSQLIRSLPSLWQMRVPANRPLQSVSVSYDLIAGNGRSNSLSNPEHPNSEIKVTLQPLPPIRVSRENNFDIIEGGVEFRLNLERAEVAGAYQGTLRVTVQFP